MDFQNTEIAFASHDNASLRRSAFLFKLLASPWMVQLGKSLTMASLYLHLPVKGLIKKTVFRQFCGGENVTASKPVAQNLWKHGVGAILDYSVEGQVDEKGFNRTVEVIMETISVAAEEEGVPLSVFKMTGVASHEILEKVSSDQRLSADDQAAWDRIRERVHRICAFAYEKGVPVMIDAEETWLQKAMDILVHEAMAEFNKERVVVMNTMQCYRTGRQDELRDFLQAANDQGYHYGIKLVRGAYMEKERERAEDMGYPSPIQPTKELTDAEFDGCVRIMMDAVGHAEQPSGAAVVIATHNANSCQLGADLLAEKGWNDAHQAPVWFMQLYGMSDNLSFNLAHAGYRVAKYLPFGPVEKVMPYLFRRAEENTSVKGQTGRELQLIQTELKRRRA